MRRVKSRILFEQMLGRATRLCPEIGKTHFEIFDAVGVYESLEPFSDMKPVIFNPSETFKSLLDKISRADPSQLPNLINQIIAKLQRAKFKFNAETLEHFKNLTAKTPDDFIDEIKNLLPDDAKNFLLQHSDLFRFLQEKGGSTFVIDNHEDFLTEHSRGYGEGKKPQDYIDEFTKFINTHQNEIAALNIVCSRPKDLSRADLKNLRSKLELENFNEKQLNAAISHLTNSEMTADIISLIRRYTLGATLLNHDEKIFSAVEKLKSAHNFNDNELKWLNRIEKYLLNESVINLDSFDELGTAFKSAGGFKRIDKVFGGNLAKIIDELNFYLYDDGGNAA
jgi:type I restriction enzyme R subunit